MKRAPTTNASRWQRIAGFVALGYGTLLLAIWCGVSRWSSLASDAAFDGGSPSLDGPPVLAREATRTAVFAILRATLEGRTDRGARIGTTDQITSGTNVPASLRFRAIVTLYCQGRALASIPIRWNGRLEPGTLEKNTVLASLSPELRATCRIRLDILRARAPIVTSIAPLLAMSLIPGIDGLGLDFADRVVLVLPDELLAEGLLAGYHPMPALDFEAGLDVRGALRLLATRAGANAETWRRTPHRIFRFRTESYVEPASVTGSGTGSARAPLPVVRGNTPGPDLDAPALKNAAFEGARYLVRHLHADGRFNYEYDTASDQEIPDAGSYSVPRHAGAALYLAQAIGSFPDPAIRDATARALRYLVERHPEGCHRAEWDCVGMSDDRTVDLGSSAIALSAAVEYQKQTGDAEFEPWARRLGAFLVMMQKSDGGFCHLYDLVRGARDEHTRLLYFSGEAALALAKLAHLVHVADGSHVDKPVPGAPVAPTSEILDRALSDLTEGSYAYFAGGFYYGEDHWTCLALDEAWDLLPDGKRRDGYGDFCESFARFIDRSCFHAGEGATREQPDLVGAYGFTPLIAPHPTPVGSRSESLISIYRLARLRGHEASARAIAETIRSGMRFLLAHQIRADNAWLMPRPDVAAGGLLMSDPVRIVRIDFVQHACSAMLRAAAIPELCTEVAVPVAQPNPQGPR